MSIGLYDADMFKYGQVPPNLELMKIAAYYNKKREIVVMAPDLVPDRYTSFYYRKDYNDGDFPIILSTTPNLEYGGLAFSNNVYNPLPLEIEKMYPDVSIYKKMKPYVLGNKKSNITIFNTMIDSEHGRISLDGKNVWEDYGKQFKYIITANNVMLHDYDLGEIYQGYDAVYDLMKKSKPGKRSTKLGMKFPVTVKNGTDLLKWSNFIPNATFYSVRYNGIIDRSYFVEYVGAEKSKSLYTSLEYYPIVDKSQEEDFLKNGIREVFRQIIISRNYRIFFPLKYMSGFFSDARWEKVFDLLNYYHNSLKNREEYFLQKVPEDTVFNFVEKTLRYKEKSFYSGKVYRREDFREIFRFVSEANPDLFTDFYECNYLTIEGEK